MLERRGVSALLQPSARNSHVIAKSRTCRSSSATSLRTSPRPTASTIAAGAAMAARPKAGTAGAIERRTMRWWSRRRRRRVETLNESERAASGRPFVQILVVPNGADIRAPGTRFPLRRSSTAPSCGRKVKLKVFLRSAFEGARLSSPWDSQGPIREELFSVERLEDHARSLAVAQIVSSRTTKGQPLARRLADNRSGAARRLSFRGKGDQ